MLLVTTILPFRQVKDSGLKCSAGVRQKHLKHKGGCHNLSCHLGVKLSAAAWRNKGLLTAHAKRELIPFACREFKQTKQVSATLGLFCKE